ncbi:MAG TPA: phosphatase PAP2 family protein [Streptosporangiaceae bacterium]|nr:phosphatase PAP2 family protein [Streptosporangiaceae bacterium]
MINLELDWRQATEVAAGLGVAAIALGAVGQRRLAAGKPRLAKAAVAVRETALALGLFALWQYAGSFAVMGPGGALGRSRWIWNFERAVRLPSETAIQRFFLPHPLLIEFFNLYYDSLHFPVLLGCMAWLFVRHRAWYGRWRTTLVAFTGLCLAVQLIPVAPPRMLTWTGLVDTAVRYHESVYSNTAGFDPDQLSAMPSVHVGWALLVAIAIITTIRSRWRWLALLYPGMTTLAVIVTANHFWLDGIVAAVILGLVLAAQAVTRRILTARFRKNRPSEDRPSQDQPSATRWPRKLAQPSSDGLVVDLDAERLREHRRHVRQLARADDRAAQRAGVDDQAELSGPEVRLVHRDFAEVSTDELRPGERATGQRRAGEIDVAQHAVIEDHLSEAGRPEVHRVQLAAAEHDIAQLGAEDLHPGQR